MLDEKTWTDYSLDYFRGFSLVLICDEKNLINNVKLPHSLCLWCIYVVY